MFVLEVRMGSPEIQHRSYSLSYQWLGVTLASELYDMFMACIPTQYIELQRILMLGAILLQFFLPQVIRYEKISIECWI